MQQNKTGSTSGFLDASPVGGALGAGDAHLVQGVDHVADLDMRVVVGQMLASFQVLRCLQQPLTALGEAGVALPVLGVGDVEDVEGVPRIPRELLRHEVEHLK